MIDQEIWVDVRDWSGKYQISNHGRLKSINGKYKKKFPDGHVYSGTIDSVGYRVVTLRRPKVKHRVRVHTLVCEHFHKKPLDGRTYWTNHKDGNKLNNHESNLEWVTPKENCSHAERAGLINNRGSNHSMSKLTEMDVREMRRLRKAGWIHRDIAKKFNICRRQAGDVVNGINWAWIQD